MITEKQFLFEIKHNNIKWSRSGNNIMINCPFHNDTTMSLGANFKKGVYNCLSCHETGRTWYLYKFMFESEEVETQGFYEEEEEKSDLSEIRKKINHIKNAKEESEKIKILMNFDINKYKRPYGEYAEYLKKRKITKQSCLEFDMRCGWYKGDKRIIFPMKDEYRRLVSVYSRSITTNEGMKKVRKSKNSDTAKILFNLDKVKIFNYCVVTEGEFDAIYLWQFGIPTVCAGTTSLSEWQLWKLSRYFEIIILALDGSVKPKIWQKTYRDLQEYIPEVKRIQLPVEKDPNELDKEEVYEFFGDYICNI